MRALALVLVLVLLGLGRATDAAAVLAPSKGSQLVTLQAGGACPAFGHSTDVAFLQSAKSDGALVPFAIPPKQILVLTAITVSFGNQVANDNFAVLVVVGSPTQSTFVEAQVAGAPASGVVAITFAPPFGIAVKSGNTVCLAAVNFTRGGSVPLLGVAHGFLAPDK